MSALPDSVPAISPAVAADLLAAAEAAAHQAYAPYSRFFVGAALLLDEPHAGRIITGCNVENASYRLTCCAEQTAITRAVAELGPTIRLRAVAIANLDGAPCSPCGACRQTLLEFADAPGSMTVFFPARNTSGIVASQSCSLGDLLPAGFRLGGRPG